MQYHYNVSNWNFFLDTGIKAERLYVKIVYRKDGKSCINNILATLNEAKFDKIEN